MQFLRSEDKRPETGEIVPVASVGRLSHAWYGDRLDEDFEPRTIEQLQDVLAQGGLTGPFWQLG